MVAAKPSPDRKEQIVAAAIARLFAVGFEGFRVGDVAADVGINNATLIHHYPSKAALIRAVIERFTQRFEAVAAAIATDEKPRTKLARHMQSSLELMRTAPDMFAVLNEIMIKARRDTEICQLVAVPLNAWREHIVSLLLAPAEMDDAASRARAGEVASTCMAQLLGMGLLLNSSGHADAACQAIRDRTGARAIKALADLVEDAS